MAKKAMLLQFQVLDLSVMLEYYASALEYAYFSMYFIFGIVLKTLNL